jgi:hypothetical protein
MKRPVRGNRIEIVVTVVVLAVFSAFELVCAYEGDPAIAGVTVSGQILYVGSVPESKRLPVVRDNEFCGETVSVTKIHVERPSGGIDGVVLSLEGLSRGKPLLLDKTVIAVENRTCQFVPRINVAVVGSELKIINSDPILHNTHIRVGARSGRTFINVAQPAGVDAIIRKLGRAGIFDVRCDAHTFMQAFIHVFEHPYFAVTDSTGRFRMTQVPPGTYRLHMWHEALGTRTKTITVPSAGPLTLDLVFGLEE